MTHLPLNRSLGLVGAVALALAAGPLGYGAAASSAEQEVEMAVLQLKLGRVDEAREKLHKVLEAQPHHFQAQRALARVEIHAKRYPDAVRAAAAALSQSPDDAQCRALQGSALLRQGQAAQGQGILSTLSAEDLQKWTEDLPADELAPKMAAAATESSASSQLDQKLDAIYTALAKKDVTHAAALLAEAEKHWPTEPELTVARAQYALDQGQPVTAVRLLEQLRATQGSQPGGFSYRLDLASAYEASGQRAHAMALYEQLIASPTAPAEQRATARQMQQELRQQQMLDAGDQALAMGNVKQAEHLFSELAAVSSPEDPTVLVFQANVLQAQGRHVEAARIYSSLKSQVRPGKRFDTQLDYAGSLASARRTDEAIRAYTEITESPAVYSQEERSAAQAALEELRQSSTPSALVEGTFQKMDEGSLWRLTGQASSARLQNGMRLHARSGRDDVHLSSRAYPEELRSERWFSSVGFDTDLGSKWAASVFGGAYDDGGLAHMTADYSAPSGFSSSLRLAWNDPARDTILLEALNGRQHAVAINTIVPLGSQWAWDTTLAARQIEVDGQSIGSALDSESQLRWHPYGCEKDVYLGYTLDMSDFSPQQAAFSAVEATYFQKTQAEYMPTAYDAVPDSIQRHALQAHASTHLTDSLVAGATVEVGYRNETRQVENAATAELLWHATRMLDINARVEYYTSGAGPNMGQDVFLGALGLKVAW